jgi:hypothetical protein
MSAPARPDRFPAELIHLTATAIDVLDKHVNLDGRCAACGDRWPCERARLADHNLAGL